jgi:dihydrofolate synthase / folylpolyglutamate synthase
METYEQLLKWAYDLQKFGIKFGLSSTARLLERLGNPECGLKFIHIGGSNGKGSVAAILSGAFTKNGLKVGLYTSPHLVTFEERFKINDEMISRERARQLMALTKEAIDPTEPPTFFEFTTAMALLLFAQEKTDIAILEVGMGGRLDATNIVEPLVSVITNISLEHQEYLGRTLLEIAGEKAGIIKAGVPLVSAATQPEIIDLFSSKCAQAESPLYLAGREFKMERTGGSLRYLGLSHTLEGLKPGLQGDHQAANAAVALCVSEVLAPLGFGWNEKTLLAAIQSPRWPGRFQVLDSSPTVILDGAHNPGAAETMVNTVKKRFQNKRIVLVLGIMADKDIPLMLKIFARAADEVVLSRPGYARAADPQTLLAARPASFPPAEIKVPLAEAIELARTKAGAEGVVVITGSLFTVGEAMEILGVRS